MTRTNSLCCPAWPRRLALQAHDVPSGLQLGDGLLFPFKTQHFCLFFQFSTSLRPSCISSLFCLTLCGYGRFILQESGRHCCGTRDCHESVVWLPHPGTASPIFRQWRHGNDRVSAGLPELLLPLQEVQPAQPLEHFPRQGHFPPLSCSPRPLRDWGIPAPSRTYLRPRGTASR